MGTRGLQGWDTAGWGHSRPCPQRTTAMAHGVRALPGSVPAGDTEVSPQDVDIRELPRAGDSGAAFSFFRSYRDGLWRFESAAHPGWFLCTSPRGHQPLALCRPRDVTSHLLDFYFQLC
uniref:Interleukin-1 receptor antagonist protein n=1 Tax=Serinus canaria TaxID=9135 RepID=A0A8C9L244_SERCA